MAISYSKPDPDPDDENYGILGPVFATNAEQVAQDLWVELVGIIPKVLPENGEVLEYSGLETALFGHQMKQPLNLKYIPLLLAYAGAMSAAITTLRRTGVIEYTRAFPLMYLRLVRRHE